MLCSLLPITIWHIALATPALVTASTANTIAMNDHAYYRNLSTEYQPKAVITVESHPSRVVWGSLSIPEGSPWCNGKPTYWLIGHQVNDTPWCLVSNSSNFFDFDYTDSVWEEKSPAILDQQDELNVVDGPRNIDRHDCTAMDVNQDGLPDVLCGVGANKGTGYGFNEVYLTQTEGSLIKVLQGHGLHQYPTMRNRLMVSLHGTDGSSLVFLGTMGIPRVDGRSNVHRMFRLTHPLNTSKPFFFEEVPGPWTIHTKVNCLQVCDLNHDGLDDIVMCNKEIEASIFLQNADSSWDAVEVSGQASKNWRNARVTDVTGDGISDLIVVGSGGRRPSQLTSYLHIFEGTGTPPFFDFSKIYYKLILPYASPDIEILDVNGDGKPDIYVVQVDEATHGTYCAGKFDKSKWFQAENRTTFEPPVDRAPDLLLVGTSGGAGQLFTEVVMEHAEPGCGFFVELFGNNRTMILGQGNNGRPGHNLLLQW